MLELVRVSKHFSGIPAVDDVTFSARPGQVTGYLGPNGSGKSTTMKMITGLIEMTFGQISFQGKLIQEDLIAYKRRMGYVPEEPYLYTHLSGAEYLDHGRPAPQSTRARVVGTHRRPVAPALALRRPPRLHLRLLQGHAPEGSHRGSAHAQSRAHPA